MSLVAYADSSDDESGSENDNGQADEQYSVKNVLNGHISDEDEYEGAEPTANTLDDLPVLSKKFNLPPPKNVNEDVSPEEEEALPVLAFDKLPKPKPIDPFEEIVEEEDEYLHKKEKPTEEEKPPPPPRVITRKGPAKITIPLLSEFKDLEVSKRSSEKQMTQPASKSSGLLNLLPKPKSEIIFENTNARSTAEQSPKQVTSLIPDSVKNNSAKKIAQKVTKQPPKRKIAVAQTNESEDSDEEATDFFSLNSKQELPAVSEKEIKDMVAKKAAEIANAAQKVNEMLETKPHLPESSNTDLYEQQPDQSSSSSDVDLDKQAIQALVGSRAKRQKMEEVNIVELSASEVLPDKGEWLRTALASSTSYQPKGVLVDEEPAPGTRRKHQITYLAHQAKANELELQAMWAANRHTRRQTQGKYGF